MQISGASGGAQAAQIQQWRDRKFQRADQDQNGGLSLSEFSQMAARRHEQRPGNVATAPADSAGTPANSAVQDMFKRLDTDNDGNLSRAELDAGRPAPPNAANGALGSGTFNALLASQGQASAQTPGQASNTAGTQGHRHHHRREGSGQDAGTPAPNADAMMQRLLAAYQARQSSVAAPASAGTTLTA